MAGRLVVCATPIGNLGDVSERLGEVLRTADVVFAEDTRRTSVLLAHVGASVPVRSFFVGNESVRVVELETLVSEGHTVALVTDAGTPALADPGVSAVRAARRAGGTVTVVPGPSAVTAALAVSGFGGDRFVFEGFLPRRGGERRRRLDAMAADERAVVWFSTPRRLVADLADLAEAAGGGRELCVARELTKQFEELWWGTVDDAVSHWTATEPRGEFTIVVAPGKAPPITLETAVVRARALMAEGRSRSEAARTAAQESGLPRREIYEAIG